MGQYQQWLHHREADRQLRAQLGALETELTQLQGQARLVGAAFEADQSLTSNAIIRALAIHLNEQTIANSDAAATSTATASHGSTETISPALFGWSRLPNFGPQDIQQPLPNTDVDKPLPSHPHLEMDLLPEDMAAFFDEHSQTEPQLELPWWLHNIVVSAGTGYRNGPIDQESIRTNRLVQRWLERWGRQSPHQEKPQEDQSHE